MGLLFWQEEGDGDGVANTLIRRNLGRTFLSNGFNYKVKILGGFPAHPVAPLSNGGCVIAIAAAIQLEVIRINSQ